MSPAPPTFLVSVRDNLRPWPAPPLAPASLHKPAVRSGLRHSSLLSCFEKEPASGAPRRQWLNLAELVLNHSSVPAARWNCPWLPGVSFENATLPQTAPEAVNLRNLADRDRRAMGPPQVWPRRLRWQPSLQAQNHPTGRSRCPTTVRA